MKISFAKPGQPTAGAHVVLAYTGANLSPSAKVADERSGGAIQRALKASRFKGELAEILEIVAPSGSKLSRLVVVGAGAADKADLLQFELIGGALAGRFQASGETALTISVDEGTKAKPADAAAALASGLLLRSYRFDRYRTKEPESRKPSLTKATILCLESRAASAAYSTIESMSEGIFFTRDLVSEPANVLTPKAFSARLKALGSKGLSVEVLGEKEMRKLGMGALLGVAQGSANEPQLVIMRWNGLGASNKTAPVALIGKGVTFDTGGISIKPAAGMEQMKWDMGGAGAVAGTMLALASRKAKAHVVGIVGLVENMPSGTAQRPGDVVTSLSGQTIEVINTDAEGRLVLCDAMWYAQDRFKPSVMIDLATLTGAIIISLGHEHAGLFSNDDDLSRQLVSAGLATGDKLWRLPMGEVYDKLINTPIADMKNVGPRDAGSITAAQFLKRFVRDIPWAHLDIAGTVWSEKDGLLWEKGATGYGVRLLDRFIRDNHEKL
jgi:leucyl aminopeptidase